MKVGAERNKVVILACLLALAAYLGYSNLSSTDEPGTSQAASRPVLQTVPQRPDVPQTRPNITRDRREIRGGSRSIQEFRLGMKRRPEDSVDPTTVDPTLRVDLLAKLESIKMEGGERSLFEFAQPPQPPRPPEPKIDPRKPMGPEPPPVETPKVEPTKPPPPPIPLKFYGFINPARSNVKRAFFLDGEDIIVASEGELIRKRYRVVRIGVNSVVMEDVEHKHQQTLPLVEDQQPG